MELRARRCFAFVKSLMRPTHTDRDLAARWLRAESRVTRYDGRGDFRIAPAMAERLAQLLDVPDAKDSGRDS
jgi:hypothetical protein